MARRWEAQISALLARLGLTRPDENPVQLQEEARLVWLAGFSEYGAASPGSRVVAINLVVPAVIGQFSCAILTPPDDGARLLLVHTTTATYIGTENESAAPFPVLTPAGGTVFQKFRPDNREPQPSVAASVGSNGPGLDTWARLFVGLNPFPRDTWWTGTRLGFCGLAQNQALDVTLYYAPALQGMRR